MSVDNTINSILKNENDINILKNIYIDLSSLSCDNQINENLLLKIHLLMILFFDNISLREVFQSFFQIRMFQCRFYRSSKYV